MRHFYFWLLLFWISSSLQKGYAAQFGDFIYSQDGTNVTITGYMGTNDNVVVPDFIERLPVTSIDEFAFSQNTNLTEVILPDSISDIGFGAFELCSRLTNVNLPSHLSRINGLVFARCTSLSSIQIPEGVTNIKRSAFFQCYSLRKIIFSDSVTTIGTGAFLSCTNLTIIILPSKLAMLETAAFGSCSNLSSVYFTGNTPTTTENKTFDSVTIYYLPNTKGWSNTFEGNPTALWVQSPTLQVTGNNLTISWPQGVLLETTNVITGPWITNSATSPLSIPLDSAVPSKFYRVVYTQ